MWLCSSEDIEFLAYNSIFALLKRDSKDAH